ncbi:MAG TPA: peptidylprolyl isomerase [Solirubrobacteraceae bacterium]|jgi:parvulin-like peptidyl-prolyl isomerase|nr:peptidylprolyl isomerase [Solirubrobacteraceae bacterium]
MRISRKLAAAAAFFVIAIAVAACGGSSVPSNSVASVAGNPITLQAFNHWMYVAAKDQAAQAAQEGESEPVIVANDPPEFTSCIKQIRTQIPSLAKSKASTLRNDCKQVFGEYSSEVMSFLIEGYWYQADAHKLGVKYTKADLNKDFTKAKKSEFATDAAFQSYLKSSGETQNDILFQIQVNSIFSKLLKRYEKPVNAAAIAAYYKAHASTFGTKASRDVHLIRTKSQANAQAALSALKSGQTWDAVAKKYAEDASAKANGGVLKGVTPNEEEHAVNQAIFNNPVNKLVGPVKGIFGWYVVEVTKITPATHETLAKATSTIKQLLTSKEQTAAETKVNNYSKKNWLSLTLCNKTYSVSDCKGYVAPKTTTTATPTPSTSTATTATNTATGASTTTTAAGTTSTAG